MKLRASYIALILGISILYTLFYLLGLLRVSNLLCGVSILFGYLPCLVLLIPLHRLEGLRSRLLRSVKSDERGAVTLIGLLLFIVLLILFAAFSPVVVTAISMTKTCITDTLSTLILDLIPAILLLGFVISWLIYASSE